MERCVCRTKPTSLIIHWSLCDTVRHATIHGDVLLSSCPMWCAAQSTIDCVPNMSIPQMPCLWYKHSTRIWRKLNHHTCYSNHDERVICDAKHMYDVPCVLCVKKLVLRFCICNMIPENCIQSQAQVFLIWLPQRRLNDGRHLLS